MKLPLVLLVLLLFLSLRLYFFYRNQPQIKDGQKINFKTTLLSEPKVFGNYQSITANLASNQKVFIKVPRFPEFHYGDVLDVNGVVKKKALDNKRIILTIYFPKTKLVKNSNLAIIGVIRQKIISLFSRTLPTPYSSLFSGIVFGIKESMPKDFTDQLRISGVMHVIAASGMNISMVGSFLSFAFAFFFKRQVALIMSILAIIFYAFLAGFEPSIIRASIMGILVYSSQILGRQNLAAYGLFLAGFVMVFVNPSIIFDVGFQLSFAATAGLLYLGPKKHSGKILLGDLVTTIVAQASTLPILLANFGIYSIWSIIVNALVLWTVPYIMIIGGIGAISALIFEPLGKSILFLAYPLLFYFQKIVELFSGFKGVINFTEFPWQLSVGYYMILISIVSFKRNIKL